MVSRVVLNMGIARGDHATICLVRHPTVVQSVVYSGAVSGDSHQPFARHGLGTLIFPTTSWPNKGQPYTFSASLLGAEWRVGQCIVGGGWDNRSAGQMIRCETGGFEWRAAVVVETTKPSNILLRRAVECMLCGKVISATSRHHDCEGSAHRSRDTLHTLRATPSPQGGKKKTNVASHSKANVPDVVCLGIENDILGCIVRQEITFDSCEPGSGGGGHYPCFVGFDLTGDSRHMCAAKICQNTLQCRVERLCPHIRLVQRHITGWDEATIIEHCKGYSMDGFFALVCANPELIPARLCKAPFCASQPNEVEDVSGNKGASSCAAGSSSNPADNGGVQRDDSSDEGDSDHGLCSDSDSDDTVCTKSVAGADDEAFRLFGEVPSVAEIQQMSASQLRAICSAYSMDSERDTAPELQRVVMEFFHPDEVNATLRGPSRSGQAAKPSRSQDSSAKKRKNRKSKVKSSRDAAMDESLKAFLAAQRMRRCQQGSMCAEHKRQVELGSGLAAVLDEHVCRSCDEGEGNDASLEDDSPKRLRSLLPITPSAVEDILYSICLANSRQCFPVVEVRKDAEYAVLRYPSGETSHLCPGGWSRVRLWMKCVAGKDTVEFHCTCSEFRHCRPGMGGRSKMGAGRICHCCFMVAIAKAMVLPCKQLCVGDSIWKLAAASVKGSMFLRAKFNAASAVPLSSWQAVLEELEGIQEDGRRPGPRATCNLKKASQWIDRLLDSPERFERSITGTASLHMTRASDSSCADFERSLAHPQGWPTQSGAPSRSPSAVRSTGDECFPFPIAPLHPRGTVLHGPRCLAGCKGADGELLAARRRQSKAPTAWVFVGRIVTHEVVETWECTAPGHDPNEERSMQPFGVDWSMRTGLFNVNNSWFFSLLLLEAVTKAVRRFETPPSTSARSIVQDTLDWMDNLSQESSTSLPTPDIETATTKLYDAWYVYETSLKQPLDLHYTICNYCGIMPSKLGGDACAKVCMNLCRDTAAGQLDYSKQDEGAPLWSQSQVLQHCTRALLAHVVPGGRSLPAPPPLPVDLMAPMCLNDDYLGDVKSTGAVKRSASTMAAMREGVASELAPSTDCLTPLAERIQSGEFDITRIRDIHGHSNDQLQALLDNCKCPAPVSAKLKSAAQKRSWLVIAWALLQAGKSQCHLFVAARRGTGGTATLCCPHGVVVIYKFLYSEESNRDYADLLRSLRLWPAVFWFDDSCGLMTFLKGSYSDEFETLFGEYRGCPSKWEEHPEDGGAPADVPELTEHRIRSKAAVDPEVRALAAEIFSAKGRKAQTCHPFLRKHRWRLCLTDRWHQTIGKKSHKRPSCQQHLTIRVASLVVDRFVHSMGPASRHTCSSVRPSHPSHCTNL